MQKQETVLSLSILIPPDYQNVANSLIFIESSFMYKLTQYQGHILGNNFIIIITS